MILEQLCMGGSFVIAKQVCAGRRAMTLEHIPVVRTPVVSEQLRMEVAP